MDENNYKLSNQQFQLNNFNNLESVNKVSQEFLLQLKFNQDGLIPAITQDAKSKKVLMMAWMNRESIEISLRDSFATYYSRSRQQLWKKGETSGHFQKILKFSTDCDFDCILLEVEQIGNACHTGAESCFFNEIIK